MLLPSQRKDLAVPQPPNTDLAPGVRVRNQPKHNPRSHIKEAEMNSSIHKFTLAAAAAALTLTGGQLFASSHQDAPLAVLDPAANTTDVYAFVDQEGNGPKSLVVALGVYPFEEPGIGPNKFNFDDNVLYEIHVALGGDRAAGRATVSYQFEFRSKTKNPNTILQNFTGVIQHVGDDNQNFVQTYRVTKFDHRTDSRSVLGTGIVPPNNQGNATPFYNQGDNGENPAKQGVSNEADLDRYTQEAIAKLSCGYVSFAGQRDDGFYADIQSIFDLQTLRKPGKDSQGGFNIHLIALRIPVSELGGDQQVVGVYATTSRKQVRVLRDDGDRRSLPEDGDLSFGRWVQVARQGNPLFNEGLVAIKDKDLYSRTSPEVDAWLFRKYAETPELAKLIGSQFQTNRTDIVAIFIPDLIKVDLSTSGVRLTNTGGDDSMTGFNRLSIFGGDTLQSSIQEGFGKGVVPGGWPNGRRFGDDVVDIAIDALLSDLRGPQLVIVPLPQGDGVSSNDMQYNSVFPYESTPQNGRNHGHHGLPPQPPE